MTDLARCPRKDCREPETFEGFDTLGRPIFVCQSCEKNKAGKCRRCPTGRLKKLAHCGYGRSKFCPKCRIQVDRERDIARRPDAYARNKAWRARPGVQAELNRKERERRKANPPTDIDRACHRAKRRMLLSNPVKREEYRAMARRVYARSCQNPEWLERRRQRKQIADRARNQRKGLLQAESVVSEGRPI